MRPDTVLRISEGLDVVPFSADEVLIQYGSRSTPSELLRDSDLQGFLGPLFHLLLQGPKSAKVLLNEIRLEQQAEAKALLDDLVERGIIADVATSPSEQYVSFAFSGSSALADRTVGVLGAGPLGARIAHSLLQHGVGHVTLLDDRPIDGQWSSFMPIISETSGSASGRADSALAALLAPASGDRLEALAADVNPGGVGKLVSTCDLVTVVYDQPNLRVNYLANRLCVQQRRPWLHATIDGDLGLSGPLFVPPHTGCYVDFRRLADASTPSPTMARRYRHHVLERGAGAFFPGLPSYVELVAGYAALGIVHFLLSDGGFAVGRLTAIDFRDLTVNTEDVLKLPRCPVCGAGKRAYRPPFGAEVVTGRA